MLKTDIFTRFLGYGEIYWSKPANLQGNYDVKLVIFPRTELHEDEIVFSGGETFENIKNSNASFEKIDSFSVFLLDTSLRINHEDNIKIYFTGSKTLLIKPYPQSYVMLTQIVKQTLSSTVNEKTALITVTKQSAKTNVMDCHCVIVDIESKLLIALIIIMLALVLLNINIYVKIKRCKYHEISQKFH